MTPISGALPASTGGFVFNELIGSDFKGQSGGFTWSDWDLSALIPITAIAVLVGFYATTPANPSAGGVRKDGSALDRQWNVWYATWMTHIVSVGASRTIETKVEHATAGEGWYLLGYFTAS